MMKRGLNMGRTKDFLMDLEEKAWEAIECGMQTREEIVAYIRNFHDIDHETLDAVLDVMSDSMSQYDFLEFYEARATLH